MARFDTGAPVVAQVKLGADVFLLTLKAPEIAAASRPGQFCMLRVSTEASRDPLLRRPLSIHRTGGDGAVEFLYRRVGKGTELLSRCHTGDTVRVLGPLGKGFKVGSAPCIVVGGGLGIAPLLYLAETLPASPPSTIILGGRGAQDVLRMDEFAALPYRLLVATEDGSLGQRGLVTDLLEKELREHETLPTMIYACGPVPMLRAVHAIAARTGVSCEVSLEARMACGIGLCLGCAAPRADGLGYKHVCKDGPVLDAGSIDWENTR